jgi:F-type H+-transporting ATPase subunit gamma
MASPRDIRRRINAAKNIKQITRAMQFVAASKLRRAQESTLAARPYSEKIDEVLADVASVSVARITRCSRRRRERSA